MSIDHENSVNAGRSVMLKRSTRFLLGFFGSLTVGFVFSLFFFYVLGFTRFVEPALGIAFVTAIPGGLLSAGMVSKESQATKPEITESPKDED